MAHKYVLVVLRSRYTTVVSLRADLIPFRGWRSSKFGIEYKISKSTPSQACTAKTRPGSRFWDHIPDCSSREEHFWSVRKIPYLRWKGLILLFKKHRRHEKSTFFGPSAITAYHIEKLSIQNLLQISRSSTLHEGWKPYLVAKCHSFSLFDYALMATNWTPL